MSLGNKINYYRQQAGMTQEQLAERMNVTRQTVSNWERGVNEPDFTGLCKLAEVFGITLNDFAENGRTGCQETEPQAANREEADKSGRFNQAAAGIMDGAALFLGVMIFFVGGLLIGGWKGWVGSFFTGGCVFLAISSILHGIAAMRE